MASFLNLAIKTKRPLFNRCLWRFSLTVASSNHPAQETALISSSLYKLFLLYFKALCLLSVFLYSTFIAIAIEPDCSTRSKYFERVEIGKRFCTDRHKFTYGYYHILLERSLDTPRIHIKYVLQALLRCTENCS